MIRKLIRNRARSAGIICEDCFDKEYSKYQKELQTQHYHQRKLNQQNSMSFFGFTDKIELMRAKTLMNKISNRNSNSLGVSKTFRQTSIKPQTQENDDDAINNQAKVRSLLLHEAGDVNRKIINDNLKKKLMSKRKEKEIDKAKVEMTQMSFQTENERKSKEKDEIKKMLRNYSEKAFQQKVLKEKIKKGYSQTMIKYDNEDMKKKIKEEFRVTCTHGVDMTKCSICNKVIAKDKMYYNWFAFKLSKQSTTTNMNA